MLAESVSSADTENQMRLSGGQYLYNLSTKGMTQGRDYTIRVRVGSSTGTIINGALPAEEVAGWVGTSVPEGCGASRDVRCADVIAEDQW